MTCFLIVTPRDSMIARDGRPFGVGQGHRMKSLDWPYPSVLAGSLRTLLGKRLFPGFGAAAVAALKQVGIAGPLPFTHERLYFPAPKDLVVRDHPRACFALRPSALGEGEGCDLPHPALLPVMLPPTADEDFKPGKAPAFWCSERMTEWLLNAAGAAFTLPEQPEPPSFLGAPEKDERMHVAIEFATGAAEEGLLYKTVGLALPCHIAFAARLDFQNELPPEVAKLDAFHTFGGERRLARFSLHSTKEWNCPAPVAAALENAPHVRLMLATPAIFSGGWKPGWLNERLEGSPPGSGVALRLRGACLDRWRPISGWSLEPLPDSRKPGPKPVRRLVPAGGVYFFETLAGDPAGLARNLWLRSVCDDPQDRRDGFGLALWGLWDHHPGK